MRVGGFPIIFRNPPVLRSPSIAISKWHYGQLGIDLFSQASDLMLDFRALRFELR